MKKFLFPAVLTTALFGVFACNNDEVIENIVPEDQKSPVEFSMTDASGNVTMANRAGFSSATRIVMQMKSVESGTSSTRYTRTIAEGKAMEGGKQYSTLHFDASNMRYWDDAFGRKAHISVFAVAIPDKNEASLLPENLDPTGTGWTAAATNSDYDWTVEKTQTAEDIAKEDLTYSNNIQPNGYNGRYTYDFTQAKYVPELRDDILNLEDLGEGCMQFVLKDNENPEGAGKFDRGHLIFNHALTRLTVHFQISTENGFTGEASDYFTSDSPILLHNFRHTGTFNIEEGKWNDAADGDQGTITMAHKENTTYQAQMLPGYTFTENDHTNVMEFTIADNTYYITSHMIWKALHDNRNANNLPEQNSYTMEMGKNYDLTITANKTAIDNITATLIHWQEVTGENINATNSYITLSLKDPTGTASTNFDLYRLGVESDNIVTDDQNEPTLTNWQGDYTVKADLTHIDGSSWKTNWFFESNKTFYHFRTVAQGTEIETAPGDDYFKIYSGPNNDTWGDGKQPTKVNDNGKYYDYRWGAPMKSEATLTYNSTANSATFKNEGYTTSLYPAIGSTNDAIKILEQHMMATVNFVLHTGKKIENGGEVDAGPITLKESGSHKATIITLQNFYGEGKVKVGSGLVSEDKNQGLYSTELPIPGITPTYNNDGKTLTVHEVADNDYFETGNTITKAYTYCIVPQKLYHGTGTADTDETTSNFIGLTIQTPDNNQYYVIKKLYGVKATEVSGTKTDVAVNSSITEWLPGHSYTYHIYINKKGIEAVTCTVVDWIDVKGTIGDVDLEY